ncbi:MAG: LuxR C-terminal-related transcriptional regulator [Chloroflexota bacterium]|nr:LuxR C-terminal-related transcriptional regulator [Chloroflexota bacterium]
MHGTHRDIADYFCEEVLNWLDPELRALLVETSILPTFSESLCVAVTRCENAHVLLTQTPGADLFVFPLDDDRAWYRYHSLFRDVLQADFARLPEARRTKIHLRASQWYEQHGMIRESVEHALSAHDLERTAALIDRHADTLLFACGETNLLASWLDRLPDDVLATCPNLIRVQAWALTTIGRLDHAEQLMLRVGDLFDSARSEDPPAAVRERDAQLAAVRARIAAYRGEHPATIQHGQEALERLDPLRHGKIHGDVVLSIGFAERALGNSDAAAIAFDEAARLGRLYGNTQAARWGVRYLALTRMSQGRLNEAEAIVDEDLDRVRQELSDPGSMLPALLISKAEILVERNDLAQARSLLEQAIPVVQSIGDAKMLMNAYVAMGQLLQAEGRWIQAREKIRRAEQVFPTAVTGARTAWLASMQGTLAEAQRWASASGFSVEDPAEPVRGEYEQAVFARIVALANPTAASLAMLDRLIEDAERRTQFGRVIELLVVRAVTAHRGREGEQARQSLRRALVYAQYEGIIPVFLNGGREMQLLLRELARDRTALEGPTRAYVLNLLTRFPGYSAAAEVAKPLAEPLTSRQLEILLLLAEGQSKREIATQLYIAEGTVKAHMHQLFGKLMARNRTKAVVNAREPHLLA